jgi:hypothetical protein
MNWIDRLADLLGYKFLWIPVISLLVVAGFDAWHWLSERRGDASKRKMPPYRVYLGLIILNLGAVTEMLIHLDKLEEDHGLAHIQGHLIEKAGGNPYILDLIDRHVGLLRELATTSGPIKGLTVDDATLALDATNAGDCVAAIDYGSDWDRNLSSYELQHPSALNRGVHINRIFVLTNELLSDPERQKSLWKTMKRQAQMIGNDKQKTGIAVMYVLKSELGTGLPSSAHGNGMVYFQYSNGSVVLLTQTEITPPVIQDGYLDPNSREVQSWKQYFKWLMSLTVVHSVSPDDKDAIPPWDKSRTGNGKQTKPKGCLV